MAAADHSWSDLLEPIVAVMNSRSPRHGDDALDSASATRFWLADRGYPSPPLSPDAHRLILDLRDGLRGCAVLDPSGPDLLHDVIGRGGLTPVFEPDEGRMAWRFVAPQDTHRYVAAILTVMVRAVVAGTWTRLRVCPGCGLAFVDTTAAGRRTWCSMARCGNRAKQARWRAGRTRLGAGRGASS